MCTGHNNAPAWATGGIITAEAITGCAAETPRFSRESGGYQTSYPPPHEPRGFETATDTTGRAAGLAECLDELGGCGTASLQPPKAQLAAPPNRRDFSTNVAVVGPVVSEGGQWPEKRPWPRGCGRWLTGDGGRAGVGGSLRPAPDGLGVTFLAVGHGGCTMTVRLFASKAPPLQRPRSGPEQVWATGSRAPPRRCCASCVEYDEMTIGIAGTTKFSRNNGFGDRNHCLGF
jgi:hypothetical protein